MPDNDSTTVDAPKRRTKRRFAHELYPHPAEYEVRALAVDVPYLYARAQGWEVEGTGWFNAEGKEAAERIVKLIEARKLALVADAMLQGLTADTAWAWAMERAYEEEGTWVYERAEHYGVPVRSIKAYPCGPDPDHHDHLGEPDHRGWQTVTRAPGTEDDCAACTESVPRAFTPPRQEGTKTHVTVHRACNGCGRDLGDATQQELDAAVDVASLPDVTEECGCAGSTVTP